MRDINRIDVLTDELNGIWKDCFPDWRFGQLMSNFFSYACNKHGDMFFWEDDKFTEYLWDFVDEYCPDYKNR